MFFSNFFKSLVFERFALLLCYEQPGRNAQGCSLIWAILSERERDYSLKTVVRKKEKIKFVLNSAEINTNNP